MPYIATFNNRYIGEHSCGRYHYGDMSIVRPCCVEDARKYKELALKNAITRFHPAYIMFCTAWNCLTDAEMEIVGDIVAVGYNEGFKERDYPLTDKG